MADELKSQEGELEEVRETPEKISRKKGSLGGFSFFIAIVALAGAGTSLYFSYQLLNQRSTLQAELSQQAIKMQAFSTQDQLQNALTKQQQSILQMESALDRMRLKSEKDGSAWVLGEVEYLIWLAKFNLIYDANVDVATKILQSADDRLRDLSSANFTPLRSALAQDLAALNAVKKVDREGIVLRLSALSKMVGDVPLTDHKMRLDEKIDGQAVESSGVNWQDQLKNSLSSLKSAVLIRRLDKPLTPLLSPEQHRLLVENIQLQLSLAGWAVLHRDEKLYQHVLSQAQGWIKEYLKATPTTEALISGIDQLVAVDVAPQVPSVARSIQAVEQAIKEKARSFRGTPQDLSQQLHPRSNGPKVYSS